MGLKELFDKFKKIHDKEEKIKEDKLPVDDKKTKKQETGKNKFSVENYKKEFPEKKLTMLWIIGSIFVFIGAWFAGHLRENIGLSFINYILVALISFLFILFGSFMWITIAVVICHEELEEEFDEE